MALNFLFYGLVLSKFKNSINLNSNDLEGFLKTFDAF